MSTPGGRRRRTTATGAVVSFDATNGEVDWRSALPESMAVTIDEAEMELGTPAIAADDDTVVVAGGERIGALDADDGALRWTQNVVSLGKSRELRAAWGDPRGRHLATSPGVPVGPARAR